MRIRSALLALLFVLLPLTVMAQPSNDKKNVAILLFDDVQTIDYAAPYEVFGPNYFNTYTVAPTKNPVTTIQGMQVIPQYDFADAPQPDVLIITGGGRHYPDNQGPYAMGLPFADNPAIIDWVQRAAAQSEYVLSICNGAFVLGKAGLLDGLEATTTAPLIPHLQQAATETRVRDDKRFVDNGKIITSGGLTAGLDASLHVVEKIFGRGFAQRRALGLEYNWDPEGRWVRPQLADRYMRFNFQGFDDATWTSLSREGSEHHWENRWAVTMPLSAAEIRALVDETLENNRMWGPPTEITWKRADDPAPSATTSRWTFTDENDTPWTGIASVEPVAGKANTYVISLRIEHGRTGS